MTSENNSNNLGSSPENTSEVSRRQKIALAIRKLVRTSTRGHVEPSFEGYEGKHDWAGPWQFNRSEMTWWRPQHYYFRSHTSGKVEQYTQLHMGPKVRPGPLRDVGHLHVPLAVLRSHPDTPNALPEEHEGMWTSTNPAWPGRTIDLVLEELGTHTIWEDCLPNNTETFELTPSVVDGMDDPDEVEPYDPTPRTLTALVVYVKPGQRPVGVSITES